MSPRQFGKVDVSASWPPCGGCPHRHMPGSTCPPTGVWLVLAMCGRCKAPEQYCGKHGGRRPVEPSPFVPDGEQAVVAGRYEREGVEG
jgi:hypothetical protein